MKNEVAQEDEEQANEALLEDEEQANEALLEDEEQANEALLEDEEQENAVQLILDELSVGYDKKVIVEAVSLEIFEEDFIGIVGDNGSGKTTLLRSILGLLKPISGEVFFAENFCRKDIGYLPQHRDIKKDFPASVYEIALSGFLSRSGFRPFYSKKERALAKENMKKLGISEIEKTSFSELSGGQQQRTLLARALCASNKMLFLDEPVAGLDPQATADMYGIIEKLNKKDGITIIMISHDIKAVKKYCKSVLTLREGGLWDYG